MNRRTFMLSSAAVLLPGSALAGVTSALCNTAHKPEPRMPAEAPGLIPFSADGKRIVFLGQEYHHVFDAPEHLAIRFGSPLYPKLTVAIGDFHVYPNDDARGSINLTLKNPTDEERKLARELDFRDIDEDGTLLFTAYLPGTRYRAKGFSLPPLAEHASHAYCDYVGGCVPVSWLPPPPSVLRRFS